MPRVALDAMGGDFAPAEPVAAAAAISLITDIEVVLVGNAERVQALLDQGPYNPELVTVRHCASAAGMDEEVRGGREGKRGSSVAVAARMVAAGEADAMVTAGNTGACILAAARAFSLLPGVERAALASVFPRQLQYQGQDPLGLLLDVGATVRCEARELARFAVMGAAYARHVSKTQNPRVGLLNMGSESSKGGSVLVAAYEMMEALSGIEFVGNVEGNEIATGKADVVICEGLLGNVVLKFLEGVGEVAEGIAVHAANRNWRWRLGMSLLSSGIEEMRHLVDFQTYGGAPILGFEEICIKAHGRSRAPAIGNAIKVAAKAVRDEVAPEIRGALAGLR